MFRQQVQGAVAPLTRPSPPCRPLRLTSAWYWKVSASVVAAAAHSVRRAWRDSAELAGVAAGAAARLPARAARPLSARTGAATAAAAGRAAVEACERGTCTSLTAVASRTWRANAIVIGITPHRGVNCI